MENKEVTTPAETTAATVTPSANEVWMEKVKAKNPGRDYESNPDEVYNASMEGYDAEHEKVKSMMASNKAIGERMMQDPKAAAALAEFMDGKPLPAALKKYFSDEELAMSEGEAGYEEYLEAIKANTERAAGNAKAQAEYEKNLEDSRATVEQFSTDKGMSPEEFDSFMEKATDVVIGSLMKGNITTELLEILYKGMNYDSDTAQAQEVGRVAGKNEKIVETRKVGKTDQLPSLGGGASTASTDKPVNATAGHFDKMAAGKQDIWEAGGYKKA